MEAGRRPPYPMGVSGCALGCTVFFLFWYTEMHSTMRLVKRIKIENEQYN